MLSQMSTKKLDIGMKLYAVLRILSLATTAHNGVAGLSFCLHSQDWLPATAHSGQLKWRGPCQCQRTLGLPSWLRPNQASGE